MSPPLRLLLALAVWLCGCPHRVEFGPAGEPKSAEDLLTRVMAAESAVAGIKGDARLKVDSQKTKVVVTLFAAVSDPAFVHLEVLDFFGKPQAVLISDGARFTLYDGEKGKLFRGPATKENVSRLVPIALAPAELAAVLLGRAPRLAYDALELGFDDAQGAFLVTLKAGAATQVLTVKPPSYRVIRSVVSGRDTYDVEFDNIEDVGSATYPRRVVLTSASTRVRVELNYKDVAVNELADPTLYDMTPPPNVPIVEVDERGVPREGMAP